MKNLAVFTVMFTLATGLFAQNNKSFCDPQLQGEIDKISNMGGTYIKHFQISPDDLKISEKNSNPLSYNFARLILKEGNTYRFYIKSLSTSPCEATIKLTEKDNFSQSPVFILHQKSNEVVAFKDIKIEKTAVYHFYVSFKNNVKGCVLVVLNFMEGAPDLTAKIDSDTSKVYTSVEENAKFKGGDVNDFRNYVAANFHVDSILMKGFTGKIFLEFIVDTYGKVQNVKVLRSCGKSGLDAEAVRVVKLSPLWTPGGKKLARL